MNVQNDHAATSHVLDIADLVVHFESGRGRPPIRAVDGVSLHVARGETLGLIGESGSGKTTIGRAALGLLGAKSGTISVNGVDIWAQSRREQRRLRSSVQVIFQDPSEALDPRMTIAASISEPLRVRGRGGRAERAALVDELLTQVGLDPAHGSRKPHELSGGQKQRVNIARALVLEPDLIVCDEVVSALDVSIQAEILNLFAKLKAEREIALLFVSHDLSVVAHVADRVAVMYLGLLVEVGPVDLIVSSAGHPYTQALVDAQPEAVPSHRRRPKPPPIVGDIPSPAAPPSGCRFRTRCPHAEERCASDVPVLAESSPGHWVACHFADRVARHPVAATTSPNTNFRSHRGEIQQ